MVIPPISLLAGREIVLRDEYLNKLKEQVFGPGSNRDLNTATCDCRKEPLSQALDQAKTAPFLSEKRLIIIDHIDTLKAPAQKILLAHLKETATYAIWVLMTDERKAKRSAFLKKVFAMAEVTECEASYKEADIRNWVAARFKAEGKAVEMPVINLMMHRVGKSLTALSMSVEQLVIMTDGKDKIILQDAANLLGEIAEQNIYDLYEALKAKRLDTALAILKGLKLKGSRAHEVVASLVWQFERLFKIKNMLGRGMEAKEVATALGVHPYVAELNCRTVSRIPRENMLNDLNAIYTCDKQIKRGLLQEDLALEQCILALNN
ncbi:MAG: DNA polymerase-3 subunit delta [Candidatus Omnitrophota bacterium]|jgi:DNA polymerase-3 subunit delta